MKAHEFDQKFDSGEDVSDLVDWSKAKRKNMQTKRVNVDFPAWMVTRLDKQAKQLGVARQSLIKCGSPSDCNNMAARLSA